MLKPLNFENFDVGFTESQTGSWCEKLLNFLLAISFEASEGSCIDYLNHKP